MESYVDTVRSFDSHERGILLKWATGNHFKLASEVRSRLGGRIGRQIPEDAFVVMDYTLDWLYAATRLVIDSHDAGSLRPWPVHGELTASSEDIDLLVVWEDNQGSHTLLVEAKGYTGWGNSQNASKARGLGAIFPDDLAKRFDVHFVMVGPSRSLRLASTQWPTWMRSDDRVHFEPIPNPGPRLAVQRCDALGGPTRTNFSHWRAISRTWDPSSPAGTAGPSQ